MTSFLILDLDKTISKAYLGYIEYLDIISSSIKNILVLQDYRTRLGNIVGVLTSFLMLDLDETFRKASLGYIDTTFIKNIPILLDLEDRGSLDKLPNVGS